MTSEQNASPGAASAERARILVVDDEPNIRELIADTLRISGHDVVEAEDGRRAIELASAGEFSLLLLDVNMPLIDGFDTMRQLRRSGNVSPVIMLTARGDRDDVATGFELGVDDYIRKPFNVRELCYRVEAVLRRSRITLATPAGSNINSLTSTLSCGPLIVDPIAQRVTIDGEAIHLSATEFRLLAYLIKNQQRVVSRRELLREVWEIDFRSETVVVETYISYLRRKLHRGEWKGIHNIRGHGYQVRSS